MNYSFWKLLRAQWSWNNDKSGLLISLIIAVLLGSIMYFTNMQITNKDTGEIVNKLSSTGFIAWGIVCIALALWNIILYHTVKFILMCLFCGILVFLLKSDKTTKELKQQYHLDYLEALTWRQ